MPRTLAIALVAVFLAVQSAAAGQKSTVAKQRFVVHVPSKVTVGPVPLKIEEPTTESSSNVRSNASDNVAAYRIAGTSSAGLLVQFEVRPVDGARTDSVIPEANLNVRVDSNEYGNWNFSAAGNPSLIEASSNGIGAATFVLGTNAEPGDVEIVATVISNE